MPKYYINKNNERHYIKEIDYANGKLTFTTNQDEAYNGRGGYYADATKDLISRGFSDEYPEVAELSYTYSD